MPKFNKITHYCVIGTVLKVSKSSQELNTSTFFFFISFFFFFPPPFFLLPFSALVQQKLGTGAFNIRLRWGKKRSKYNCNAKNNVQPGRRRGNEDREEGARERDGES